MFIVFIMNKGKTREWIKEKHNFIFILIVIFSLGIRFYYMDANSTVWWDEASYLSTAKHWFFDVPYVPNPQNAVLFPFFIGLLLKLGLGESTVKFFLVVLPSLGSVVVMYFLFRSLMSGSYLREFVCRKISYFLL